MLTGVTNITRRIKVFILYLIQLCNYQALEKKIKLLIRKLI